MRFVVLSTTQHCAACWVLVASLHFSAVLNFHVAGCSRSYFSVLGHYTPLARQCSRRVCVDDVACSTNASSVDWASTTATTQQTMSPRTVSPAGSAVTTIVMHAVLYLVVMCLIFHDVRCEPAMVPTTHIPAGERLRNLILDVSSSFGSSLEVNASQLEAMLHDNAVRGHHDLRDVQFLLGFLLTSGLLEPNISPVATDLLLQSAVSSATMRDRFGTDEVSCMLRDEPTTVDLGIELYIAASGMQDSLTRHVDEGLPFVPSPSSRRSPTKSTSATLSRNHRVRGSGNLLRSLAAAFAGETTTTRQWLDMESQFMVDDNDNAGYNGHNPLQLATGGELESDGRELSMSGLDAAAADATVDDNAMEGVSRTTHVADCRDNHLQLRPLAAFASSSAAKSRSAVTVRGSPATNDAAGRTPRPLFFFDGNENHHDNKVSDGSWDGCDDGGHFMPAHAIDGDPHTRWAAAPKDKSEWLVVALGRT